MKSFLNFLKIYSIFFLFIVDFNCKKIPFLNSNEQSKQEASNSDSEFLEKTKEPFSNLYAANYSQKKDDEEINLKWDEFDKKAEGESYYIVNDPNGLAVYTSREDFTSKKESLSIGVKFKFTTPEKKKPDFYISTNKIWWKEIEWEGKRGWIPWDLNSEKKALGFYHYYLDMKAYPSYALSQKSTEVLELPVEGSNAIEIIPAFKILKSNFSADDKRSITGNSDEYQVTEYFNPTQITWYEVETSSGKVGYVSNKNVYLYSEKEMAETSQKVRRIFKKGYFVIKNTHPKIYLNNPIEVISKKEKIPLLKEKYHFVTNSEIIQGNRYYNLGYRSKEYQSNSENRNILISEKDGWFLDVKEFSEYTMKYTSFKGDKRVMNLMNTEYEKNSMYLNYSKFELRKITNKNKNSESYYLAKAYLGANPSQDEFDRSFKYMIFQKKDKSEYFPILSGLSSSIPIRILDLDKDGIYELETEYHERAANTRILYIRKDGKYVSSSDLLPNGYEIDIIDAKKGLIYAGLGFHWQFRKEEREKGKVFKLQKGELIPTDIEPTTLTDIKAVYKMRE